MPAEGSVVREYPLEGNQDSITIINTVKLYIIILMAHSEQLRIKQFHPLDSSIVSYFILVQ